METAHFVKINLFQRYCECLDSFHCMLGSVNILDERILVCGGCCPMHWSTSVLQSLWPQVSRHCSNTCVVTAKVCHHWSFRDQPLISELPRGRGWDRPSGRRSWSFLVLTTLMTSEMNAALVCGEGHFWVQLEQVLRERPSGSFIILRPLGLHEAGCENNGEEDIRTFSMPWGWRNLRSILTHPSHKLDFSFSL